MIRNESITDIKENESITDMIRNESITDMKGINLELR